MQALARACRGWDGDLLCAGQCVLQPSDGQDPEQEGQCRQ